MRRLILLCCVVQILSATAMAEDYLNGLSGDSDSGRVAPGFPTTPTTIPSSPTIGDSPSGNAPDMPSPSATPSVPPSPLSRIMKSLNTHIGSELPTSGNSNGSQQSPWLMDVLMQRNRARPPSEMDR